jgi:hypothetical protein
MNIGNVFRSLGFVVLGALLVVAADHTVLAQRAGGHAGAGAGRAGAPVGHPGAGYGGYGGRGGYGARGGYGGRGYGWGGRWGWGLGWGWLPLGVYLSVLPWYYSTYWWDGVPYYYADNNYYIWDGSTYQQVQPPEGFNPPAQSEGASGSGELFAYPRNGQSAAKLATDQSECRAWAATQSGYRAATSSGAQRQEYLRAEAACLEGRGYAAR